MPPSPADLESTARKVAGLSDADAASNFNVARRLTAIARQMPDAIAVAAPGRRTAEGRRQYAEITFAQLDRDSDLVAAGLHEMGVQRGTRLALLVRPGIDFITLVFGLFKVGAISILIDPGMGRKNTLGCLAEVEPQGFVAIPQVQAVRWLLGRRFPLARFNVTVGRRLFWDGTTLAALKQLGQRQQNFAEPVFAADEPAAIIFTTGSTGPPKGVLYRHGNFDRQVTELRDFYDIRPGEIDLPGFPLFGLFNCAMGVTTVVPDMDPTRPARVDPLKIIEAVHDWNVTQSFGSPAIWNRVGIYCEQHSEKLPSLRRVLSAGAPVPPHVLARMKACIHGAGEVHTPYGATESLPVASISASEVLQETSQRTRVGAGVCVGRRFPSIVWKVIRAVTGPIPTIADAEELPCGEIGELIVSGPVVTTEYVTRREANATAKIADGQRFWHRMGDVGYLDEQDRFWFCGRMTHRVLTSSGPMYTICCEAIFNCHASIYRSALIGVGPLGQQRPVIVVEPWPGKMPKGHAATAKLVEELRDLALANPLTASIRDFLVHPSLPVDIRHNAKIFREKLAVWAEKQGVASHSG